MTQKLEKRSTFFTGSLTKTKTLLPVARMLSLGPWPRVLPKRYETMFNMHKNKRLLWGVHDQKRARPRTRKEQPGAPFSIGQINPTLVASPPAGSASLSLATPCSLKSLEVRCLTSARFTPGVKALNFWVFRSFFCSIAEEIWLVGFFSQKQSEVLGSLEFRTLWW